MQILQAMWSEFELNSVSNMNGTSSVPINFGVRAKRIKKGSYGISGTVTITDALDGYDVDKDLFICFVN